MLKRKLCEATFEWALHCDGPLLIADGRYDYEKLKGSGVFPQKVFISHASTPTTIETSVREAEKSGNIRLPFYVPGTSLRGPFRAQVERIIRSFPPENELPPLTACDPFETKKTLLSCSKRLESDNKPTPYARACPACKVFGCTGTASRIRFTDAEIVRGCKSVYRDMIGIDRFTGGVFQGEKEEKSGKRSGGANMRLHALEQTSFSTTVTVTNFELWQLGLLAYVFRDFQEGLVPIGYGKTKGFGSVTGTVKAITLTYPVGKWDGKIQHLGSLVSDTERQSYSLDDAPAKDCVGLQKTSGNSLSLYEAVAVTDQESFYATVAPVFNQFIETRKKGLEQ